MSDSHCEHKRMQFASALNLPEPDEKGVSRYLTYECMKCGAKIVIGVNNDFAPPTVFSFQNIDDAIDSEDVVKYFPLDDEETANNMVAKADTTFPDFHISFEDGAFQFSADAKIIEKLLNSIYNIDVQKISDIRDLFEKYLKELTGLTEQKLVKATPLIIIDEAMPDDVKNLMNKARIGQQKKEIYTVITENFHVEYYYCLQDLANVAIKQKFLIIWNEELPFSDAQKVADYLYNIAMEQDISKKNTETTQNAANEEEK